LHAGNHRRDVGQQQPSRVRTDRNDGESFTHSLVTPEKLRMLLSCKVRRPPFLL
jgi:hypothetical protein